MSRILVTGSTDGLGRLTAESLQEAGHEVVVHARSDERARSLAPLVGRGAEVIVGDFSERDAVLRIAGALGRGPRLDAVIHNVGVYDGPAVLPVNVVAPYLLTALLPLPERVVFLSSGMHLSGSPRVDGVDWTGRRAGSYSDSKLFVTTLMAALARIQPGVLSNAVDPGWVPTRMGGAGASDDLELGHRTQEWLVTSDDPEARTSGGYWYHRQLREPHASVNDIDFQDQLLEALAQQTGIELQA